MSAPPSPPPDLTALADSSPRKSSSTRVGLLLLLLVMLVYAGAQVISRSGPSFSWRSGDLDSALAEAKASGKRVFLLLYEPNCPITASLDRGLFQMHFARERLSKMVCCRVEVKPGDALRARFEFDRDAEGTASDPLTYRPGGLREPMMFVLDGDGRIIGSPLRGRVEERDFTGFVHPEQR